MIDASKLTPAEKFGGLSSFGNLLQMVLGFDETDEEFDPKTYLQCLGLLPGSRPKPTHPFYFPNAFPADGPMEVLPLNVATEMDAAFAELRSIEAELLTVDVTKEPHPPVVKTLANNAMVAVRRIGSALGYRRWDSGENMVRMFQLARAMPSDAIGGAELVQCVHDYRSDNYVWEDPEESNNRVSVRVLRLIFRLADADSIETATPARFSEWENRCQSIGAVHNALFPGEHCIVEFRDKSAATVSRSSPIGPSYAEVIAEQEAVRAKNK